MDRSITLALDVAADASTVFRALSTTAGQRAFWTADCDVQADRARFGFAAAPVDLQVAVSTEPGKLVRMHVTSRFPFWEGLDVGMELGEAARTDTDTGVLFRHHGFADGYPETDLAYTAQTWAMILDRLAGYVASGTPQPYFPETPASSPVPSAPR
jgi:uncharacterized protein YndB with AHSA1/START domain